MLSDYPVFPILLSTDLDASRTFYHDVLGLEIAREDHGDRIVFRTGGGTQIVVTLSTTGTSDTQTQMAFRVPDIHAAVAEVRARGVRIEEYAGARPGDDGRRGRHGSFVGGLVHRSEPERPGSRPAQELKQLPTRNPAPPTHARSGRTAPPAAARDRARAIRPGALG